MRRQGKCFLLLLPVGVFLAVQLPPPRNPPPQPAHRSIWEDPKVAPEVKAILRRSCADCHSDQTRLPWYGHVAPVSWMLARDIERGRQKLDLSNWPVHPENEAEEIGDAVASGKMPPWDYLLLHTGARLSSRERSLLDFWMADQASSRSAR